MLNFNLTADSATLGQQIYAVVQNRKKNVNGRWQKTSKGDLVVLPAVIVGITLTTDYVPETRDETPVWKVDACPIGMEYARFFDESIPAERCFLAKEDAEKYLTDARKE